MRGAPGAPRLLILGGSGFIGGALAAAAPDALAISGALGRSPQGLRQCLHAAADDAVVIHAAGSVARGHAPLDPRPYIDATRHLFAAIAATGSSARVLTLGSVAERLPGDGAYACIKREQQALAHAASEGFGIPWRHVRLHNVIGPAVPPTLAPGALALRLRQVIADGGRSLPIRDGAAVRDYLDVRDLAAIVLALAARFEALDRERPLEICSGTGRSIRAVAAALVRASGATIELTETHSAARPDRVVGDPAPLRSQLGPTAGARIGFGVSISDLWDSCARLHPLVPT